MDKSFYLKLFFGHLATVLAIAFLCAVLAAFFGFDEESLVVLTVCVVGFFVVLLMVFLMVGIGHAVYHDANRRGMPGLAWALVAVFVPYFLGIIVYLIVREPLKAVCGACGRPLSTAAAAFCLHCGHRLRQPCPSCEQPVDQTARFCPHCGAKIAA